VTPLIVTGRLELRPFGPEDAAKLHEIFSDPETHTIGQGPFTSLAETAAWISRRAETERQCGLLWYAVRAQDDDRILGNCGLFTGRTGSAEPEIGYEIRRSCQGRGLATEGAHARARRTSRAWPA
jgi:ribosomal-protein-alanine N-acetyltransferase